MSKQTKQNKTKQKLYYFAIFLYKNKAIIWKKNSVTVNIYGTFHWNSFQSCFWLIYLARCWNLFYNMSLNVFYKREFESRLYRGRHIEIKQNKGKCQNICHFWDTKLPNSKAVFFSMCSLQPGKIFSEG